MSEDIKNEGFLNEKLPCPYCGEKRSNEISLNGSYEVKSLSGGDGKKVSRFLCRSCGNGYTQHTKIIPEWDFEKEKQVFRKLKSHHNQNTEDELFKRIDDLIIEKGLLEVAEVKRRLRIGTTTYYRYIKKLRSRLFWNENIKIARAEATLKEAVLLELKTKIQIEDGKRPEILRVFVLFDKESQIAYDYFLVRKKKFFRRLYRFSEQTKKFGHFYITPELIKHLSLLKGHHPQLVIELDCEVATTKRLLKMAPHLFRPSARNIKRFWHNLEKFKMRRNLSFTWTMTEKKQERERKGKKPPKTSHPALMLNRDLHMLLSIHNQHHISRLNRN